MKGPDLFATNPDVWIEAVMPGVGTGEDAMEYPQMGVVYDAPVATFILRLRSAFETKARALTEYIENGPVQPGHATVIAVSGAMLPDAIGEGSVPRILKAILGVGNLVLDVSVATSEIVGHAVEHNEEVEKKNRASVRTDPFLGQFYAHVSAVLYSASNWVTHPSTPGIDFTLIHNENANVKLPRGWLGVGHEYWREGDSLQSVRHSLS